MRYSTVSKSLLSILLSLVIILLIVPVIFSDEPANEDQEMVNQRAVVLDFVNTQKNEDAAYLADTIPSSLEIALVNTENFQMLDRSTSRQYCADNDIPPSNLFNESVAAEIGKFLAADVVVIGSYVMVGNILRISVKAIDPDSMQIYAAVIKEGDYSDPFALIDALIEEMADKMTQALPPIPARTVVFETRPVEIETQTQPVEEEKTPQEYTHPLRPFSWVSWGIGAASLGAGIILNAKAGSTAQEAGDLYQAYLDSIPSSSAEALESMYASAMTKRDTALSLRTWSIVSYGVSAVGAGVGLFFWLYKKENLFKKEELFKKEKHPENQAVSFAPLMGFNQLGWTLSFRW